MKTFRMVIQLCPNCGYELDASTKIQGDDTPPGAGDLTVCMGCAVVLQFGPELKLEVADLEEIPADVRRTLEEVSMAVIRVRSRR